MKIFYAPRTRSSRVIWMVEELQIPYELVLCDIMSPERKDSDEFLAASPMGKVPAIQDGDVAMSESAAICLYLADRYSGGTLAPRADDPLRGAFLYWMFFSPAVIEPTMAEKASNIEGNRYRNGWGDFDLMIETLSKGLEGREWLLGESFSAADVMVGSSAAFLKMFNMLSDAPEISDYVDRCLARPAYQKAMEIGTA